MTADKGRAGRRADGGRVGARGLAGRALLLLVPALAACGAAEDDGTTTPSSVPSAGTASVEPPFSTATQGAPVPTGPPITASAVAATARPGDVVVIDAALIITDRAELCDVVGETAPPVCSPAILELTGASLDDLNLFEASGVQWGGVVIVAEVVDTDTVAYLDAVEPNETPSAAPEPRESWSVADALEIAEPNLGLVIDAVLVTTDAPAGSAYLCDEVRESDPPVCDEPRVEVTGVPLDELDLDESGGEHVGPVRLAVGFVDESTAVFLRAH